MFGSAGYVKSRGGGGGGGGRRGKPWLSRRLCVCVYDLCALYVLCDPVSLSLYSLSDRVTPCFSPCLLTITLCLWTRWWTLIYNLSQRLPL